MISDMMEEWIECKGKEFLRDIGIKKNQFILDYGCGHGVYTIPASLVVGNKGKVFAVDRNQDVLNDLKIEVEKRGLRNVEIIEAKDNVDLLLPDNHVDVILLYDVLHLLKNREQLLAELYHILKPSGILSVFPKHHKTEMKMNLEEVKEEVELAGFNFQSKILNTVMHDDKLEKGYILNFKKN